LSHLKKKITSSLTKMGEQLNGRKEGQRKDHNKTEERRRGCKGNFKGEGLGDIHLLGRDLPSFDFKYSYTLGGGKDIEIYQVWTTARRESGRIPGVRLVSQNDFIVTEKG